MTPGSIMKTLIALLLAFIAMSGTPTKAAETGLARSRTPNRPESTAEREARMKWFREARFGMFIHWGLYSQAAGEWDGKPAPGAGEWIMNDLQIHPTDYARLVPQFNPEKFNAHEWVSIAKNAGMKYIVITTKHHDGFAIYPSALTDWSLKSTPFKRDPLKELAVECQKEGITLCFYHSIMDWHHPDYVPRKSWHDGTDNPPDFEKYVAFMKGQLKELLTNYGPIGVLWFDGCWESSWTHERGTDLYNYLRTIQPNLIINNRVGSTAGWEEWFKDPAAVGGDFGTPEQAIPAQGFGANLAWESCMTMNDTWGFKQSDQHWKTAETLVRNLIDCASKGGNYLLNVGPTGAGLIPDASIERLKAVGDWMKVNRKAIYTTSASPFSRQLPWGRCTTKLNGKTTTLYLHVFDWPHDGELLLPGLKNKVKSATLLASSKKLSASQGEEGVTIGLPASASNPISSTVVLEIEGAPELEPMTIVQKKSGVVTLPASQANLHGTAFRYESGGPLDDIGYWTDPKDWADWDFKLKKAGKFQVSAIIAAPASGTFEISVGGKSFRASSPVTASYMDFKPVSLGTIEITALGKTTLAVRPIAEAWQPMNLKLIQLTPVDL
jgi:alpha-L-fucosidase